MAETIFLGIPNAVFSSDLLRTRYIRYLSEKYRVLVLVPARGDHIQSPNVFYEQWILESPKFWERFKFLRISLVNEFDYLNSIKYFYRRPNYRQSLERRLVRTLGKPFAKILTADFFTGLEAKLLSKSAKFSAIVKENRPILLVTATPGLSAFEADLIHRAKRESIPTVAVNFTWDNLTMNAKHIRKADYLIAWNEVMKREAVEIHHYLPSKVFVSGTPRFDPYFTKERNEPTREQFLKSKGLNSEHKTIFYTTVTKAYPFQKKYICDLIRLREQKKIPYTNIFVRIHPLDVLDHYKEFSDARDFRLEKSGENTEMLYADLLNLKYSLKYTDLNINYASTISIEACIFDKPIINIGHLGIYALAYEFNHYQPIVENGAVRVAKIDEDLPRLINMYLDNPGLDQAGRQKVVRQYVQFTDGLSYKRSVDYLDEIISNGASSL